MPIPVQPKIYHIVHIGRLASIINDGCLWSDAAIVGQHPADTTIGMTGIKERRRTELYLSSHPKLLVGQCVPFYFCSRSVMLYLIWKGNHENLQYRGGQEPIIHLEADLNAAVAWANQEGRRWAFTLSNAGARYFDDRCDLAQLDQINWAAVGARQWSAPSVKEGKQAEFLIEHSFPWHLVERIGVCSQAIAQQAAHAMRHATHRPRLEIRKEWYYP